MPKDKRARSVSQERHSSASPFSFRSSNRDKHLSASSSSQNPNKATLSAADIKEWEEARCPICMEHPHNAVMLICASNEKGCHAYMCDTSYRHSNCLDQFCKSFSGQSSQEKSDEHVEMKLCCPLCRGVVKGWKVVEAARHYMNAKVRSCSLESCTYSGTYEDLRKHARMDHPFLRPAQADPERQHDWRRLEQQRDLGDLLSSMRSSLGMEETEFDLGEVDVDDGLGGSLMPASNFARVTLYIFIQFLGTGTPNMLRYFSRTTPRRIAGGSRRRGRAHLWGEAFAEDAAPSSGRGGDDAALDEFVLAPELQRPRSRRRRRRLLDEEDAL